MGLDLNGIRFLLFAQNSGVEFENTAMIGRQRLDLSRPELKKLLMSYGYTIDAGPLKSIFSENEGYAEAFLKHIGAENVHSFDVSSYEGATHLHDMNEEILPELKGRYSVVLDGGSLEHVFNFPIAIKNCMEMLQVGGHYLGITPANNFMGHGFYQFSPELYFNIFTPKNGFEMVNLIAFEDRPGSTWYVVKNPEDVKSRVTLVNSQPVYLLVLAKKITAVKIFNYTPQQSDYVAMWSNGSEIGEQTGATTQKAKSKMRMAIWIKNYLPFAAIHLIKSILLGHGFSSRFFTPMESNPARKLSKKRII